MKKKKNPLNAPAATTQKSDAPKPTVVLARPLRTKSELLSQHHSDVKLIPKLQDKSIEEQILSTVDRETTTSTASNNHVKPTTYLEEVQHQSYYLSLSPKEPSKGRGALLQIHGTIRRRCPTYCIGLRVTSVRSYIN